VRRRLLLRLDALDLFAREPREDPQEATHIGVGHLIQY
jgi:hypothetical protein